MMNCGPRPGEDNNPKWEEISSSPAFRHGLMPWLDPKLSDTERLDKYKLLVCSQLEELKEALERAGPVERQMIEEDPKTEALIEEAHWLSSVSERDFVNQWLERGRRSAVSKLLGRNFLGAEAWRSIGVDVGVAPRLPSEITEFALRKVCPFHPSRMVYQSHLLVLVPKTVNGEPYSALELKRVLSATPRQKADPIIYDGPDGWANAWQSRRWANEKQPSSEWVFLPKDDPDPTKVRYERHFRSKSLRQQQTVLREWYPEYRQIGALELMTSMVLNDLVNGERLLEVITLRCRPASPGPLVRIGLFSADGLKVIPDESNSPEGALSYAGFGLALNTNRKR